MSDINERLVRFYTKYNPEKISTIPDILKAFAGKEEQLILELTKRYGPEPTAEESLSSSPPRASSSIAITVKNDGNDVLRARLHRFYNHYNPNNVGNIEKVIEQFKHKESELFAQLVEKYGPEPASDPSATPTTTATTTASPRARSIGPSSPDSSADNYRDRLTRLMQAYLPAKVDQVDQLLEKYKGREMEYINAIVQKYGPEPAAASIVSASPSSSATAVTSASPAPSNNARVRIQRLLQTYMPTKVDQLEALLEKYKGREEEYISAIVQKYGPEPSQGSTTTATVTPASGEKTPAATTGPYRDRLLRLLHAYLPAKTDQVDQLLEKYKGREEEYINALIQKYGPEPSALGAQTPSAAPAESKSGNTPSLSASFGSYEDRLTRFYAKYLPTKIGQVTAILEKYKDREEEYLAALVAKYGAEPAVESSESTQQKSSSASDQLSASPLSRKQSVVSGSDSTKTAEAAAIPPPTFEARLTAYFQAYAPNKVGQVSAMAEKYKGREEEYMAALVGKYGAEPTATQLPPGRGEAAAAETASDASRQSDNTMSRKHSVVATAADQASPSSSSSTLSFRDRLTNYFQQYTPNKMGQVDAMLEKYKNREEEYLGALVTKYGPEPAVTCIAASSDAGPASPTSLSRKQSVVAPATPPPTAATYEARITRMFSTYLPNKMEQLPAMLEKYKGREEDYLGALVGKYGPEPDEPAATATAAPVVVTQIPGTFEERVRRYFETYTPNKMHQVTAMTEKYKDREEEYMAALVAKYGPEPATPSNSIASIGASGAKPDIRSRVEAFYAHYQPDKVSSVDAVLQKYVGREEELINALIKKYGPEPGATQSANNDPTAAAPTTPATSAVSASPASPKAALTPTTSFVPSSPNLVAATVSGKPMNDATQTGSVDLLAEIPDGEERSRLQAIASAQGFTVITDAAVLRLIRSLDAAMRPAVAALQLSLGQTEASPHRQANSSIYAAKQSPSRSQMDLNASKDRQQQTVEETKILCLALSELEQQERQNIEEVDADERCILLNTAARECKRVMVKVQFERAVYGNENSLRRRTFHVWQMYAKARRVQRRMTQARGMPVYQRLTMTPLAQKFYDTIQRQEEKKAEKLQQLKEIESRDRAERIKRQRALAGRTSDFVAGNAQSVSSYGAPGMGHYNQLSPTKKVPSPQRHSVRRHVERQRSPRHSTSIVYVDPHTGSPTVTPASQGKPSLAKMVALRGGPSPSSRVDFLDREARLSLIQQQFDLLPPNHKARVFRQLKKWNMVPVLAADGHFTPQQNVSNRDTSIASTNASINSGVMFSPNISKRVRIDVDGTTTRQRDYEGTHGPSTGGGHADTSFAVSDVSQDALEAERQRMEACHADKLFNSPFIENGTTSTGGVIRMVPQLANQYPFSQTPMSVSYAQEDRSPLSPVAAVENSHHGVRSVAERLNFQSPVDAHYNHPVIASQREQKNSWTDGPLDDLHNHESGDAEDSFDNEDDLQAFMQAALMESMTRAGK